MWASSPSHVRTRPSPQPGRPPEPNKGRLEISDSNRTSGPNFLNLGVDRRSYRDEFVAAGLNRHRFTDDWMG
jgi:hypothetical protein